MGRALDYRKARKFKRWGAMAKAFTRMGREIAVSVKEAALIPKQVSICKKVTISVKIRKKAKP